MTVTVDLILDLSNPGNSQNHRDGIGKSTGVDRYCEVTGHQNMILMRLKVTEMWLDSEVVSQVHQAVARGTDEGVQPHLEEE